MRILPLGLLIAAVGSSGCKREDEPPPPAESVLEALMRSLKFEDGDRVRGQLPNPVGTVSLRPTKGTVSLKPGTKGTLKLVVDDDPTPEGTTTLVQLEGSDEYFEVDASPDDDGSISNVYKLDGSVCDNLCDIKHRITVHEVVLFVGGLVSEAVQRQLELDCTSRGRASACGDMPDPDPPNPDPPDTSDVDAATSSDDDAGAPEDAASGPDPSPDAGMADAQASTDASACNCFSSGRWQLSNTSPCIFQSSSDEAYLYSSQVNEDGTLDCGGPFAMGEIPDVPEAPWTTSTLRLDCAGEYELCFTIKAGDISDPQPGDCEVVSMCLDVTYLEADTTQMLEDFPGWRSSDTTCANRFAQRGGYAEMSVIGMATGCGTIDDGTNNPLVFHRIGYCSPTCQETPDDPACVACAAGGSGAF